MEMSQPMTNISLNQNQSTHPCIIPDSQFFERLIGRHIAHIVKELMPHTRVEQVAHGMFATAR